MANSTSVYDLSGRKVLNPQKDQRCIINVKVVKY